ncbi:MAG: tryptophan synthase subunit alpha [Planctomycetota bacterium]|nr:tryptophan synthase subunit alpha [Planctomycetota bacterium]
MPRISDQFASLRSRNAKGLIPYVCGGHPRPGTLAAVLPALEAAGATFIEVGIPFSDPIADGPVIAAAMHTALQRGSSPASTLAEIAQARPHVTVPLIAMVSVSIVHRMSGGVQGGPARFVGMAKDAGIDGFIFPDAPLSESGELLKAANDAGLTASLLIAPTTTPQRAEEIMKASTGFVYLLARSGITGERQDAPDIGPRVAQLRRYSDLPIACGFGISSADHVRAVNQHADAAIVGSALVRRMSEADANAQDPVQAAADFCRQLSGGL